MHGPARVAVELADALTAAGFSPMPARVFSAVLADADGQMTSVELQQTLGVSAGAVSGAVGYLENLGLLARERLPGGGRREVYVVQDDAWHEVMLHNDRAYQPMIAALERGVAADDTAAEALLRLEISREFLTFVGKEMTALAERWEVHKHAFLNRRD